MAEDREGTAVPLSDAERLDQLEASVKFHRVLVIVLGALTVVMLTMVITAMLVLPGKSGQKGAGGSSEQLAALRSELGEDTKTLRKLEESVKRMEEVQAAYVQTMDRMGVIDRTSQTEAMLALMIQQHADYRENIRILRSGMNDLAQMVPGSRTWLQEYNERLNRGLAAAKEREKKLMEFQQSLEDPEPAAQPAAN